MSTQVDLLTLVVGMTTPVEVHLLDQNGVPEDLSGADRAVLTVADGEGGPTPELELSTEAIPATLAIDVPGSRLLGTLTGVVADALTPGRYVGQAIVRFGDEDSWFVTQPFDVEILAPYPEKP